LQLHLKLKCKISCSGSNIIWMPFQIKSSLA
jgi:hypothetical protein